MTRRERVRGTVGVGLMILGTIGPWAHAETASGAASVSGFGHGAGIVLACSVLVVLMLLAGLRRGAVLIGAGAAAWTALVMLELPSALVEGSAWQAELAWGSYLALLGALIVATTRRRAFDR